MKYQVLCSETAFLGVAKQNQKSTGEVKHIALANDKSFIPKHRYEYDYGAELCMRSAAMPMAKGMAV